MAILASFIKQPYDRLDYDIDYSRWLSEGDEIQTVSASAEPSTLLIDGVVNNITWVKVWLSEGVNRTRYKVTVNVVTTDGREKQDEFTIAIKDY